MFSGFKEMLDLDGLETDIDDTDLGRRNLIVKLLVEWGLVEAVDAEEYKEPQLSLAQLKIIPHIDLILSKYKID